MDFRLPIESNKVGRACWIESLNVGRKNIESNKVSRAPQIESFIVGRKNRISASRLPDKIKHQQLSH